MTNIILPGLLGDNQLSFPLDDNTVGYMSNILNQQRIKYPYLLDESLIFLSSLCAHVCEQTHVTLKVKTALPTTLCIFLNLHILHVQPLELALTKIIP